MSYPKIIKEAALEKMFHTDLSLRYISDELGNLTAKTIILESSEVEFLNVKIISSGVGLTTTGTELKATNLVIEAPVGIKTKGSELDIAGATINYSKESHIADGSLIYWSTSYLRKKGSDQKSLHEKQ